MDKNAPYNLICDATHRELFTCARYAYVGRPMGECVEFYGHSRLGDTLLPFIDDSHLL